MVRTAFHAVAAASLLLLCSPFLCAQDAPPHQPRPKLSADEMESILAIGFHAYWTLEPGWNTIWKCATTCAPESDITPVLEQPRGELSLAPVTVAPQHVVSLNLRSLAKVNPKASATWLLRVGCISLRRALCR